MLFPNTGVPWVEADIPLASASTLFSKTNLHMD